MSRIARILASAALVPLVGGIPLPQLLTPTACGNTSLKYKNRVKNLHSSSLFSIWKQNDLPAILNLVWISAKFCR